MKFAVIRPIQTLIIAAILAQTAVAASSENMVKETLNYNDAVGKLATGDLFLPHEPHGTKVILLIHGGGWNSMDRYRMEGIVKFLLRENYAVFNIDYRLLPQAAYPACEEDCMTAARFLLDSKHPSLLPLDRERIFIMGASAGGHLSLMTGFKLPREKVAGIVDISGPTDLTAPEIQGLISWTGFTKGQSQPNELLRSASPALLLKSGCKPPPVLIIHSTNDTVVSARQADRLMAALRECGSTVQAFFYDKNLNSGHDIWADGSPAPALHSEIEQQIATFLRVCQGSKK